MLIKYIKKNKIIKETMWSFFNKIIPLFFTFLLTVYIARSFEVKEYGIISFFFSILSVLILISGLGINVSAAKYTAQYNKSEKLISVLNSGIKLRIIASLIFAFIIILTYKHLAVIIMKPELSSLLLISVPLLFLKGLLAFLKNIFVGLHRLKYSFVINLLESILKLLLIILFFNFATASLLTIISVYTLATLLSVIVGFLLLYRNYYTIDRYNKVKIKFENDIINYSIPLFFISIGVIIASDIDIIMLGLLSTNEEVGYYSISKHIITKLPLMSFIIATGVMPIFAKFDNNNRKKLTKFLYSLLRIMLIVYSVIFLLMFLLSPYFIPFIFGTQYQNAIQIFQYLLPYSFIYSFSIVLSAFLTYQGLAKKRVKNLIFSTILNITLNYILIPKYGAIGAAISTSISYFPYVLLNWMDVRRVLKNKT